MIPNTPKRRLILKWLIGIFIVCALIYLVAGHMRLIMSGISWFINLIFPLLLGLIMALIFNVPMRPIEQHLFRKTSKHKLKKIRRPLAILLSLLLIFGIFIGVAFLVIPELVNGVKIVIQNIAIIMDRIALLSSDELAKFNIDWWQIKSKLEQWLEQIRVKLVNSAIDSIGTIARYIINFFIGLVFSVYLLGNKEKLKKQVLRFIQVWLPAPAVHIIIHVSSVSIETMRHFITGQAIEAFILGSLCTIGMWLLGLPYAPMIGSLIGVTALLPMVGAYIGAITASFVILTVNPVESLIFLIFIIILQQIEGNLLYPRVVGSKINLPAMWVLAAIIVGGNIAGPAGMFLGVPIVSSAYALLREATAKHELEKKEKKIETP